MGNFSVARAAAGTVVAFALSGTVVAFWSFTLSAAEDLSPAVLFACPLFCLPLLPIFHRREIHGFGAFLLRSLAYPLQASESGFFSTMEGFGGLPPKWISNSSQRKRSSASRLPRKGTVIFSHNLDVISSPSTPTSEDGGKVSSDENAAYCLKKELNLNHYSSVASPSNWRSINHLADGSEALVNQIGKRNNNATYPLSAGPSDEQGHENKLKKVKLKLGGVTRTIHTQTTSECPSFSERPQFSFCPEGHKLILEGNLADSYSPTVGKSDFLKEKTSERDVATGQVEKHKAVRKSKRIPKKRIFEGSFVEDDNDDEEIRYLEKLRTSRASTNCGEECEDAVEERSKKQRKLSRVMKMNVAQFNLDEGDHGLRRSGSGDQKSCRVKGPDDTDYVEDEESVSDEDHDTNRMLERNELVELLVDSNKESTVTTRQRALRTSKDLSSSSTATAIDFPNGLPPAPPRKQKGKVSEVELQLKKAEAAQRRKMQMEKADKESQAEAIRKILGQDSSRKKREDKLKKLQEGLVQERAANAMKLSSNTVRWVLGPNGTVVTFSDELGLPSIFDSKPCSYPGPREKCAGPSCMNPYKYRDSKSRLPLCSLQCYKAIRAVCPATTAC